MPAPTIFIIDDHAPVREALAELLAVYGFATATFDSADRFLALEPAPGPGCIVADVRMPGTDGIALIGALRQRGRALPVVLISGHADVPMAVAAIKAGADEFIEKPVDDVQLVAAINRALGRAATDADSRSATAAVGACFTRLTARQVEVFDLVAAGLTSQAIGARLGISVRTVESYRAEIMTKMQADSVATLVRQAIRLGRLTP